MTVTTTAEPDPLAPELLARLDAIAWCDLEDGAASWDEPADVPAVIRDLASPDPTARSAARSLVERMCLGDGGTAYSEASATIYAIASHLVPFLLALFRAPAAPERAAIGDLLGDLAEAVRHAARFADVARGVPASGAAGGRACAAAAVWATVSACRESRDPAGAQAAVCASGAAAGRALVAGEATIRACMDDPDPAVARAAIRLAGHLPSTSPASDRLEALLDAALDEETTCLALLSLAWCGEARHLAAVQARLGATSRFVRGCAAHAVTALAPEATDDAVVDALFELLDALSAKVIPLPLGARASGWVLDALARAPLERRAAIVARVLAFELEGQPSDPRDLRDCRYGTFDATAHWLVFTLFTSLALSPDGEVVARGELSAPERALLAWIYPRWRALDAIGWADEIVWLPHALRSRGLPSSLAEASALGVDGGPPDA